MKYKLHTLLLANMLATFSCYSTTPELKHNNLQGGYSNFISNSTGLIISPIYSRYNDDGTLSIITHDYVESSPDNQSPMGLHFFTFSSLGKNIKTIGTDLWPLTVSTIAAQPTAAPIVTFDSEENAYYVTFHFVPSQTIPPLPQFLLPGISIPVTYKFLGKESQYTLDTSYSTQYDNQTILGKTLYVGEGPLSSIKSVELKGSTGFVYTITNNNKTTSIVSTSNTNLSPDSTFGFNTNERVTHAFLEIIKTITLPDQTDDNKVRYIALGAVKPITKLRSIIFKDLLVYFFYPLTELNLVDETATFFEKMFDMQDFCNMAGRKIYASAVKKVYNTISQKTPILSSDIDLNHLISQGFQTNNTLANNALTHLGTSSPTLPQSSYSHIASYTPDQVANHRFSAYTDSEDNFTALINALLDLKTSSLASFTDRTQNALSLYTSLLTTLGDTSGLTNLTYVDMQRINLCAHIIQDIALIKLKNYDATSLLYFQRMIVNFSNFFLLDFIESANTLCAQINLLQNFLTHNNYTIPSNLSSAISNLNACMAGFVEDILLLSNFHTPCQGQLDNFVLANNHTPEAVISALQAAQVPIHSDLTGHISGISTVIVMMSSAMQAATDALTYLASLGTDDSPINVANLAPDSNSNQALISHIFSNIRSSCSTLRTSAESLPTQLTSMKTLSDATDSLYYTFASAHADTFSITTELTSNSKSTQFSTRYATLSNTIDEIINNGLHEIYVTDLGGYNDPVLLSVQDKQVDVSDMIPYGNNSCLIIGSVQTSNPTTLRGYVEKCRLSSENIIQRDTAFNNDKSYVILGRDSELMGFMTAHLDKDNNLLSGGALIGDDWSSPIIMKTFLTEGTYIGSDITFGNDVGRFYLEEEKLDYIKFLTTNAYGKILGFGSLHAYRLNPQGKLPTFTPTKEINDYLAEIERTSTSPILPYLIQNK